MSNWRSLGPVAPIAGVKTSGIGYGMLETVRDDFLDDSVTCYCLT